MADVFEVKIISPELLYVGEICGETVEFLKEVTPVTITVPPLVLTASIADWM